MKADNTFSRDYNALSQGTSGQILASQGANTNPTWIDNIAFDINILDADTIAAADELPFYDIIGTHNNKITFSNFESTLDHDNLTNTHNLTTDIDHDTITNNHNLTTDIDHDAITSGTIASHDTSATGAELDTLTDNSIADTLHRHSELVASDGSPDPALSVDASGNVGIGTATPNAPLEVKGAKPGVVGGFQSGMFHVTGAGTDEFYNSVITGHNSYNGNTQLWYLGNTSSGNNNIAFINRQNASIEFHTNNTSRMVIGADGITIFNNNIDMQSNNIENVSTLTGGTLTGEVIQAVGVSPYMKVNRTSGQINSWQMLISSTGEATVGSFVWYSGATESCFAIANRTLSQTNFVVNNITGNVLIPHGDIIVSGTAQLQGDAIIGTHDSENNFYIERYNATFPYASIVAGAADNNVGVAMAFAYRNSSGTPLQGIYIKENGNVNIGTGSTPSSKLDVDGAISSKTLTITTSADNTDVSGVNTLFVDTTSGNITLGGLIGGVVGQILHIAYIGDYTNTLTIEDTEGINQNFYNHTRADETTNGGGATYVCNGTNWYDVSHAKYV